jgi:prophage DNA circulation protein
MLKADAEEAAPIAQNVLGAILASIATRGRSGADLRTAVGDFTANALRLIQTDQAGSPLANIFELTRKAGMTLPQLAHVRSVAAAENPRTLGAMLVKNSLINLVLATEARVIVDTSFTSRNAAEAIKDAMNAGFATMEEIAADDMDSPTYQALVALHGAVTFHLLKTERPLPRMLNFQFAAPGTTLVFAYKLYDDAGRADELREENQVIHPAFMRPTGQALSA